MIARFLFSCLIFAAATSAHAQVHRCKDAAGKTVYSDAPCASGQSGSQIERQRSRAEILQEREQAYDAEIRKQDRRLTEQERALAQQQRGGQLPIQTAPGQQAEGWQARKDRENARTSASSITNNGGRFDSNAEAARKEEARKRAAQQPPTIFTHCDPGFCYDDKGGVYHKAGQDVMTGPNGKTCHRAGPNWVCS